MSYSRYALYYAPPAGPLADFGAAWLGWDIATGAPRAHPGLPALPRPVEEITRTPRKYGFHGTVKPPFRLAQGTSADDLYAAADRLTAQLPPVELDGLSLSRIGRFLALTPQGNSTALTGLAAQVVRDLDDFRAPPDEAELARRRARRLTERQEALLAAWGYPYVMEEFKFHLTLTGPLPGQEAETVAEVLAPVVAPLIDGPFRIDSLCLAGERADGCFEIVQRLPLRG